MNASSDAQTKTGELTVANIKLNASGSGEGSVINADYIQGYNDLHLVSNDSSGSHDTAIYLGTSTYTKEIGFYIDDNEKMTLDSSGRLGIGITSPSRLLDVNGSIVIRGDKQSSPHGTSYTSNEEVIRIPGPTSDYIISVQDGSGRVQHYWNSTTLSATNKYLVSNEDAGMIDWSPPSDPYLEIKYASDGTAGNDISWTTHFAIKQNGNVGIGTTSPSYKLDVAGDVNGTQLCIAGDCKSSWPSGGGLWTDQGRYIYPNNYDKFVIMDKGIVGIGTNDPLSNFDVQAKPGYNAFIRVGADAGKDPGIYFAEGTPGSEDNRWYIYGEGDSNDLYFDNPDYGDTKFVFTNEGNMGIGKTSPSYTLDVSGDIHSTGDICTDAGGGVCLSSVSGDGGSAGTSNMVFLSARYTSGDDTCSNLCSHYGMECVGNGYINSGFIHWKHSCSIEPDRSYEKCFCKNPSSHPELGIVTAYIGSYSGSPDSKTCNERCSEIAAGSASGITASCICGGDVSEGYFDCFFDCDYLPSTNWECACALDYQ